MLLKSSSSRPNSMPASSNAFLLHKMCSSNASGDQVKCIVHCTKLLIHNFNATSRWGQRGALCHPHTPTALENLSLWDRCTALLSNSTPPPLQNHSEPLYFILKDHSLFLWGSDFGFTPRYINNSTRFTLGSTRLLHTALLFPRSLNAMFSCPVCSSWHGRTKHFVTQPPIHESSIDNNNIHDPWMNHDPFP